MPTIIFKATEACNSNCAYCDVVRRKAPETMSYELLELVFQRINEFLLEDEQDKMTLIWHGGEPLLLGTDYFKKAIELEQKYCSTTQNRLEHAIQSNLTLLQPEHLEVFRQLRIPHVGTSFEPLSHIRGMGENQNSDIYNRLFFKGIQLLEKNNFGWGFIYVVTKKSLENPLDIFYYLSNLNLSGGFMMNPVLIYGEDTQNLAITPEEYADFLGAIFPTWWEHRERYSDVDPFKMLVRNYTEQGWSLGCVDSGNCAYSHIYISPKGDTSQCGRAGDWDLIGYGNIKDHSLREIFEDEKRKDFVKRIEILPETDCKDCGFWKLCHGGCPLDAYESYGSFLRKTGWCEARRGFLERYFEPITGLKLTK